MGSHYRSIHLREKEQGVVVAAVEKLLQDYKPARVLIVVLETAVRHSAG